MGVRQAANQRALWGRMAWSGVTGVVGAGSAWGWDRRPITVRPSSTCVALIELTAYNPPPPSPPFQTLTCTHLLGQASPACPRKTATHCLGSRRKAGRGHLALARPCRQTSRHPGSRRRRARPRQSHHPRSRHRRVQTCQTRRRARALRRQRRRRRRAPGAAAPPPPRPRTRARRRPSIRHPGAHPASLLPSPTLGQNRHRLRRRAETPAAGCWRRAQCYRGRDNRPAAARRPARGWAAGRLAESPSCVHPHACMHAHMQPGTVCLSAYPEQQRLCTHACGHARMNAGLHACTRTSMHPEWSQACACMHACTQMPQHAVKDLCMSACRPSMQSCKPE
eukprot:364033-Chlamydomonas_euryale.AAC.9